MRIRDLKWKGIPVWPPEWGFSEEVGSEDGVLKDVQLRNDQRLTCISISAWHLNYSRIGVILLEDPTSLKILCQTLKEHIGKPLAEIGDLKIDFSDAIPRKGPRSVRPQINGSRPSKIISKRN